MQEENDCQWLPASHGSGVAPACPGVMRIMEVLGVDAVLPIYQSLEEAMAGGGAAAAGTWGTAGPES
jgi:hypothetical protein